MRKLLVCFCAVLFAGLSSAQQAKAPIKLTQVNPETRIVRMLPIFPASFVGEVEGDTILPQRGEVLQCGLREIKVQAIDGDKKHGLATIQLDCGRTKIRLTGVIFEGSKD